MNVRNLGMRALVVTNMYPSPARPALGGFVRDQVEALRRIDDLDVELYAFDPGGLAAYVRAARELKTRYKGERFDIVHAHFGLTAWPALAVGADKRLVTLHGNDVYHPRSRKITTRVLRRMDLVGVPTAGFAAKVPGAQSKRAQSKRARGAWRRRARGERARAEQARAEQARAERARGGAWRRRARGERERAERARGGAWRRRARGGSRGPRRPDDRHPALRDRHGALPPARSPCRARAARSGP